MMCMNCVKCGLPLNGRKTKFCSRKCKNSYNNKKYQGYKSQQKRGVARKKELVRLRGGKCIRCGYDKNYSALEFHHLIPKDKLFQLDLRSLSNRRWDKVLEESSKCILLCSNCHAEEHYPQAMLH